MTYTHIKRFSGILILVLLTLLFTATIATIQTSAQTLCDGCPTLTPMPAPAAPPTSVPPADADGDGVWDIVDRCPNRGGPASNDGCPNGDADGDYVYDPQDLCPNEYAPNTDNGCLATTNPDPDGDGIIGDADKCPDIAGNAANFGCVWFDSDGDGIHDDEDQCKFEDGLPEFAGCPYDADTDYDGVINGEDLCPLILGVPELAGCPPDYDLDGVPTLEDDCPYVKGTAELNGCPPEPVDSDGDGLVDENDNCPNQVGPESNFGCPVPVDMPPLITVSYDYDNDGFFGDDDHCPDVYSTRNNGCPLPNWDGDELANIEDDCPRQAGPISNNGCPVETPNDVEPQLVGADIQPVGGNPENDTVCSSHYSASATVVFTNPRDWSALDFSPSRHAYVTFMLKTSWGSNAFAPKANTQAVPFGGQTHFYARFDIDPDVPYPEPVELEINVWGNDYPFVVQDQGFTGPNEVCSSSSLFEFSNANGSYQNNTVEGGEEDPPPNQSAINLLIGQVAENGN